MAFDPSVLVDRGWLIAAAIASYVWRGHVANDAAAHKTLNARADALSSAHNSLASREELVRVHDRLDSLGERLSAQHSEILGHVVTLVKRDKEL